MFKNMKNQKIISAIGIVWLLLWTSYIPQLVFHYPFQELKGVKSLIDEIDNAPTVIKEESVLLNKNPKELEKSVMRELRIEWVKAVSIVFAGLLAAFLLLKKGTLGRAPAWLTLLGHGVPDKSLLVYCSLSLSSNTREKGHISTSFY